MHLALEIWGKGVDSFGMPLERRLYTSRDSLKDAQHY